MDKLNSFRNQVRRYNKSNSFLTYLLRKINKSIIPENEYQNKIYLGNIFLSVELEKFYQDNFNSNLTPL